MSDDAAAIIRPFGKKSYDFIMTPPEQDARYTMLIGAVRSSKTFAADVKTIVQYSRYEVPGKRFIAGISKETVHRNMLLDIMAIAGRDNFSYNMSSGEFWLFGKQYFVIGARDEAAYKKILGSTVGVFIGDEIVEFPKSFLSQVWMRMSPEGARFLGTSNVGSPFCYLKSEVIDSPEFAADLNVIPYSLDDNPNISQKSKNAIIASQAGVFRQRYIDSIWCVASGAIYRSAWDPVLNVVDKLPDSVTGSMHNRQKAPDRYFACDVGVDHPQVTLEFIDTGDIIYITREDFWDSRAEQKQRTDGEYAVALEEFGGKQGRVIVPPEAASYRAELQQRGFWVVNAANAVSEGIATVSSLMLRRKLVVVGPACPHLVKEIPSYAWDSRAAKAGEDAPVKMNDDAVDALRYGLHGVIPQWRVTGAQW